MRIRDPNGNKVLELRLREAAIKDGIRGAATALAYQTGNEVPASVQEVEVTPSSFEVMLGKRLAQLEGRYRSLLEAAPDAIVVVNQDGEIILLNVQGEKQFGYDRDELLGKSIADIIPSGFVELLAGKDAEALARQARTGIELAGRRKDGSGFPIEVMLSPMQNADGILVTASIRNISAHKAAERQLSLLEGRYRGLLEAAPDAMVVVNKRGKIVLLNVQAENHFGYSRDELLGQKVTNIIPVGFADLLVADGASADAPPQQAGTGLGLYGLRKDGTEFPIEIMLSSLKSAEGAFVIAAIRNTTERRAFEQHLVKMEARYRGLIETAPDAMVVVNADEDIIMLNLQAEKRFGYSREELLGRKITSIIPIGFTERMMPDALSAAEDALTRELGTGIELYGCDRDGTEFPIEVMLSRLEDPDGTLVTAAIRDITARRRTEALLIAGLSSDGGDALTATGAGRFAVERDSMEEALFGEHERAEVTLNCIADAVACTDRHGRISFLNKVAERMTGWTLRDASGRPIDEVVKIVDAATRDPVPNPTQRAGAADQPGQARPNCLLVRRDGFETPIEDSVAPIHDRKGRPAGAVIVFRDVRAARTMALEMAHSARHDFLTGLPNRMLFNDRVSQSITVAPRHGKKVAVLFVDLDGFKHVNDSLGHTSGDKLLQSIAKRLVACVRSADTVSRQGGDEFVVLLSEIERAEDATILAARMLQAVADPHTIDGNDVHVSASIGVSIFPDDGHDAETLIKNADTAMYQAKESGRQCFRFFTPSMNERAAVRRSIELGLRRALEQLEFSLVYQPKVNLRTGEISGAEALIRWSHTAPGSVSPADFIPVAESSGLIQPIGHWVLREACHQTRAWLDAGLKLPRIAVNVSAFEFRNENFLEGVFAVLDETNLDGSFLELELTESVLMKHVDSTDSILQALRDRGVKLAVDDFGTGYSSLSNLRKFPIDTLKIDQSFVRQIGVESHDTSIVTTVLHMARSLKLRCVAEGVETAQELAFLQANHCDSAQGYYFSKPLPPVQFGRLLQTGLLETMAARRLDVPDGLIAATR